MPIGYTNRGFADYAKFKDTAGTDVTIRQSSIATYDAVWIFIAGEGDNDGAAHLDAERARTVVAALQEWLRLADAVPAAASNGGQRQ